MKTLIAALVAVSSFAIFTQTANACDAYRPAYSAPAYHAPVQHAHAYHAPVYRASTYQPRYTAGYGYQAVRQPVVAKPHAPVAPTPVKPAAAVDIQVPAAQPASISAAQPAAPLTPAQLTAPQIGG
jgi:hypothetical protein